MLGAWYGAIAYGMQIYFDFSGYSDIAIGLGRVFGFHFDENFDHPFMCKDITEFWQRWHISLGTFFRDYLLYIPIFGKRRKYGGLFLVWLCTGIWHGASWNYIFMTPSVTSARASAAFTASIDSTFALINIAVSLIRFVIDIISP